MSSTTIKFSYTNQKKKKKKIFIQISVIRFLKTSKKEQSLEGLWIQPTRKDCDLTVTFNQGASKLGWSHVVTWGARRLSL